LLASTLLVALLLLAGCGRDDVLEWTEDVRLPDGRVVTLKRMVEFKGPQALGDTPTESFQRLEFRHPETGETVEWESHKEKGYLKTVAIWIRQGQPVLLLDPAYGDDKHKFNCPNPPYLLQEYVDKRWENKALSKIGIAEIRSNMTAHPKDQREAIARRKYRLTAEETSNSYIPYKGKEPVPYVISFVGASDQTFDVKNCFLGPDLDDLILKEAE
jgi:hypothetical protein